jgi:hypothetical protein
MKSAPEGAISRGAGKIGPVAAGSDIERNNAAKSAMKTFNGFLPNDYN